MFSIRSCHESAASARSTIQEPGRGNQPEDRREARELDQILLHGEFRISAFAVGYYFWFVRSERGGPD